ncbi:uncharacterized protein LY89DRAFT_311482 [Mollisia scopiformis]|uniref:Uncharacterized protein n=1 Tax=Mollisia scopiformis TaxID=149040 RepID=A0A194XRB5_MOLSC|nr:uncharacterized protein LY89DRAFT_311482 [Mollisia scopiformis]KUJ22830.1 hypothetical protein LY89DRAFT_311482 [Mollisia scopiformis]
MLREGESFKRPPNRKKQQSFNSPEFWEAVNSIALQSKKHRSDTLSITSIIQSVFSEKSRTRSQRRALRRFTREIELYLQAARTLPKQSLVPSITATSISANTVLELKPYQSQFQSAGLAVTSEEQRRASPPREFLNPPQTPPKDEKWEKMAILSRKSKIEPESSKKEEKGKAPERGPPSFASGSTGTTVLGFTPPHEKSYPRPKMERKQPSLESDHTILGFTPPHERMITPPPPPPNFSELRPTTKRSLPWLRRNSHSPEASPTKRMSFAPVEQNQQPRASTPLQGWVSTFEIADKSTGTKNEDEIQIPKNRPKSTSRQSSATRWRDSRVASRRVTSKSTKEETKNPIEPSPAVVNTTVDGTTPCHHVNNYVNTAVQADVPDDEQPQPEVSSAQAEPSLIERAPILISRNKTFPVPPKKCTGDCYQATEDLIPIVPPKKSARPSRVTWQGVNSSTQTETLNTPIDEKLEEATDAQKKKLFFPSTFPTADRSSTFPFYSRTVRSSRLVQQAPRMKSPNKSMDETKSQIFQNKENAGTETSNPPSRRPPSPPALCSQCAGPIDTNDEILVPGPTSELDPETEEISKSRPTHACTSRSSILCQQCFPSRQVSLELSPLEATSPVEVSYHPLSRRSTRPTIPTEIVTYPEEVPHFVEQPTPLPKPCLDSVEGKEMYRTMVKETLDEFKKQIPIADPMKQFPITRVRMGPPSKPQMAPQRRRPLSSSAPRAAASPLIAQRPLVTAAACSLNHVASSTTSLDTVPAKSNQITDKQVFRGLHVATAAACDEDVDRWIEEITGMGVRKFLAGLNAFEGLGVNTLANVAKRAARQRRDQMNAWEEVRKRKLASQSREIELDRTQYQVQGVADDKLKVGEFVIGDQGVYWNGGDEQEEDDQDDIVMGDQGLEMKQKRDGLLGSMSQRRDYRESEGARERAVKMGWRERSVSG